MNLPSWIAKWSAAWIGVGTLLMIFGAQGVAVPQFLIDLFSQKTAEAVTVFIGAVIAFLQFVRTLAPKSDAQIHARSAGNKWAWANPFKIAA